MTEDRARELAAAAIGGGWLGPRGLEDAAAVAILAACAEEREACARRAARYDGSRHAAAIADAIRAGAGQAMPHED